MIPITKANIGPNIVLLAVLAASAGCASKTPPVETATVSPVAQAPVSAEAETPSAPRVETPGVPRDVRLERVHFAFDSYTLDDQARARLQANAEQLRAARELRVVIEGHCDDVGTTEYNLVLGERRADATRRYLATLGVEDGRLGIISYGKEKPRAGEQAENRRAEFTVR